MTFLSLIRWVSALPFLLAAHAAVAQSTPASQALDLCARASGPEAMIQACTSAIGSGQLVPRQSAAAYVLRGTAFAIKSDLARAIADYDAAIGLSPDFVEAYLARGDAYYRTGRLDRSLADFEQALRLHP